jgi:DnaK suppressor protein
MVPATELHGLLVADRERTAELISSLSASIASMVEAARLTTSDDEHDPEGSTIAFERSQASTLLATATEHLADVDAALARIAAGTYGVCERCGREIAPDRLRARPTARTCITCAAAVGPNRAR